MQRGSQLFTSIIPPAFQPDKKNKGKRNLYIEKRNECLAHRFYYYSHISEKRWDVSAVNMSREFFLSPRTILDIVTANAELLKEVVAKKPDKKHLRKLYPQFNWN